MHPDGNDMEQLTELDDISDDRRVAVARPSGSS